MARRGDELPAVERVPVVDEQRIALEADEWPVDVPELISSSVISLGTPWVTNQSAIRWGQFGLSQTSSHWA